MGVKELVLAIQRFMDAVTPYLNKLVIFFIILFIGFLLGRILGKLIRKLLSDTNEEGANWFSRNSRTLGAGISLTIYVATIILAVWAAGVTKPVLILLLTLVAATLVVSAFLALRDIVPNLVGWLHIRAKKRLRKGAAIKVDGIDGTIIHTSLIDIEVETKGGDLIIIPNALFLMKEVRVRKKIDGGEKR